MKQVGKNQILINKKTRKPKQVKVFLGGRGGQEKEKEGERETSSPPSSKQSTKSLILHRTFCWFCSLSKVFSLLLSRNQNGEVLWHSRSVKSFRMRCTYLYNRWWIEAVERSQAMENTPTTTSTLHPSSSILTNYPLISALVAFAIAQSIKFFTSW